MSWVADFSMARPGAAALKAAGAVGVMRYLCPGRNDGVNITAAEIADFNANSLPYGLVCEYEATWLLRGYQAGKDLAVAALTLEQQLGIPRGVMYLACDFDAQPNDFPTLLNTMQGWADGYGGWQYVRPYGSKAFCEWVQANSPARGSWSTYAWSWNPQQGRFEHAADARLWQYNFWPIAPVQDCDFNEVLGDWGPRNGATDWFDMATETDLENAVRKVLNEGTAVGQQNWASTNKAILGTVQANANSLRIVASGVTIVIQGGNGNVGIKQVNEAIGALQRVVSEMPAGSGGTVDPGPIVDGVVSGVKGLSFKAS